MLVKVFCTLNGVITYVTYNIFGPPLPDVIYRRILYEDDLICFLGGGRGCYKQKILPPLPPETDTVIIIIQQLLIKTSCVKVICLIQIIP